MATTSLIRYLPKTVPIVWNLLLHNYGVCAQRLALANFRLSLLSSERDKFARLLQQQQTAAAPDVDLLRDAGDAMVERAESAALELMRARTLLHSVHSATVAVGGGGGVAGDRESPGSGSEPGDTLGAWVTTGSSLGGSLSARATLGPGKDDTRTAVGGDAQPELSAGLGCDGDGSDGSDSDKYVNLSAVFSFCALGVLVKRGFLQVLGRGRANLKLSRRGPGRRSGRRCSSSWWRSRRSSGGSATTLKSWGPPEEIKKPDVEQRAGGRSMLFLVGSKTDKTKIGTKQPQEMGERLALRSSGYVQPRFHRDEVALPEL